MFLHSAGQSNTKDTIIKDVVIALTVIVTFVAMWYIYNLMNKVKPEVIYARRKARYGSAVLDLRHASNTLGHRQAKESGINTPYSNSSVLESTTNIPFNHRSSDSELPLTANFNTDFSHQQWDSQGRAVGYASDPTLYAPQPQKPARVPSSMSSQGSSSAGPSPAPHMSERDGYRAQPLRQNTGSSTASWDVQGQVGGPNSYQMSRPQYNNQFPNPHSGSMPPPQYQQQSYSQSPPPMRSVGQSGSMPSSEQTPTQAQFQVTAATAQPVSPHSAPLPNPYSQFAPPAGPPPQTAPVYAARGYEAPYSTAGPGSRPRTPEDPYVAYTQPSIR